MRYLRIEWHHAHPDEPLEMFSELDDDSWEVRKVERFAGGRAGFAGPGESSGTTALGLEPIPPLDEIARDPQFVPTMISPAEFERAWRAARQAERVGPRG